jgi:hypothetical protein
MRTTKNSKEYIIPRRDSKSEPPQCKSITSTILQYFKTKTTRDISILCLPHLVTAWGCQPRTRFTCKQKWTHDYPSVCKQHLSCSTTCRLHDTKSFHKLNNWIQRGNSGVLPCHRVPIRPKAETSHLGRHRGSLHVGVTSLPQKVRLK